LLFFKDLLSAAFRDQASPNRIRFTSPRSAVDAVTRSAPVEPGAAAAALQRGSDTLKPLQNVIWTLLPQKIGT
jgi:hypothetical protein